MNFQETLEFMYRLLPMYQRVGKTAFKKDLTNTIALLDFLGNPHHQFKSVHIAGTNGKGSSAHMLASVLQSAGYKVGLYTSPHLKSFTERIKHNGQEVEETFVIDFIERIRDMIIQVEPSFFEVTVAMAFDYFAHKKVDIAVVEVGMGGRFDSTNVLHPIISLITSIAYDHMEFLGDTLPKIAFEKAGIIKKDVPVVISETQAEITHVFDARAQEMESKIFYADTDYKVRAGNSEKGAFEYLVESFGVKTFLQSDLGGIYQQKNIPGVLKVVDLLGEKDFHISDDQLSMGFRNIVKNTGLKGRWQKLSEHPLIICDTAHNEAGVKPVFEQIQKLHYANLHIIWGAVDGKNLDSVFQYFPKLANYYFCEPSLPRALNAEKLLDLAHQLGLNGKVIRDVNEALNVAKQQAAQDDLIFVGGSNFVVAEINGL